VPFEIKGSLAEPGRVIIEVAEPLVARLAQQAPESLCRVAMVNDEVVGRPAATDGAGPALRLQGFQITIFMYLILAGSARRASAAFAVG
jgi:hypothetical protein